MNLFRFPTIHTKCNKPLNNTFEQNLNKTRSVMTLKLVCGQCGHPVESIGHRNNDQLVHLSQFTIRLVFLRYHSFCRGVQGGSAKNPPCHRKFRIIPPPLSSEPGTPLVLGKFPGFSGKFQGFFGFNND